MVQLGKSISFLSHAKDSVVCETHAATSISKVQESESSNACSSTTSCPEVLANGAAFSSEQNRLVIFKLSS